MTDEEPRRPNAQEDLAALLSNPDALRFLAFGARTMGRFVETGRDLSRAAFGATGTVPPPQPMHEPASSMPEGTMLVPVEAWNRVLDQLGNLHEAGRELAEARERAARAEATAEFHAERRKDAEAEVERLRRTLERSAAIDPTPAAPVAPPSTEPAPPAATGAIADDTGSTTAATSSAPEDTAEPPSAPADSVLNSEPTSALARRSARLRQGLIRLLDR